MANVVAFKPKSNRHERNARIIKQKKEFDLFEQALNELKQETGLDYFKLLTGDEKEQQRKKMKQYQEALLDV